MQQSSFHMQINPIWDATSGKYTKDYVIIRSAPGQKCVSFNYGCRMTYATEPHANEAESIPLTPHVRGAPITGDALQKTSKVSGDPVPFSSTWYIKWATLPSRSKWKIKNMWNRETFLASPTPWETPMMEAVSLSEWAAQIHMRDLHWKHKKNQIYHREMYVSHIKIQWTTHRGTDLLADRRDRMWAAWETLKFLHLGGVNTSNVPLTT